MAKPNPDGTVTLSAEEYGLVLAAMSVAKALCFDMEAEDHRDEPELAEVRLLSLVERLEAIGLRP